MPGPRKGTPRPATPRSYVGLKLSPDRLAQVDALAAELGWQRSETLRRLLGHALTTPSVHRALRREAWPAA